MFVEKKIYLVLEKEEQNQKQVLVFFFYKDNKTRQISALNTTFTGIYKQW